jgi:hypothetical protein
MTMTWLPHPAPHSRRDLFGAKIVDDRARRGGNNVHLTEARVRVDVVIAFVIRRAADRATNRLE